MCKLMNVVERIVDGMKVAKLVINIYRKSDTSSSSSSIDRKAILKYFLNE